jgi:hypothetical protein
MDIRHFDALAKALTVPDSRRRVLGLLAAAPLLGGLLGVTDEEDAAAKERRRRRKQRHKRRKNPGKRKRKQTKKCKPESVAQTCAGKCGSVTNTCKKAVDCGSCACDPLCGVCFTCQDGPNAPGTCVADPAQAGDTCGDPGQVCQPDGACACDATSCPACTRCEAGQCVSCGDGHICVDDVCQACDVTCTGSAAECGADLQAAFAGSKATLYVCPGEYAGGFTMARPVTVIGAGQGETPASNTILDGGGTQRVLHVPGGTGAVVLAGLRVTGGHQDNGLGAGIWHRGASLEARDCTIAGNAGGGVSGAGVYNEGTSMTLRRCTITNNHTSNDAFQGDGGGISHVTGTLTLEDCLVTENRADNTGGGLRVKGGNVFLTGSTEVRQNTAFRGGGMYVSDGTTEIAETCRVTRNEAGASNGGGIWGASTTVTLLGASPSPIVVNNCHENCAGDVQKCAATPVFCPA